MRRVLGVGLLAIGAVALVAAVVVWAMPRFETDDLETRVAEALADGGHADAVAMIEGRDVTVTVADETAAEEVRAAVTDVDGVRLVTILDPRGDPIVDPAVAPEPATIELSITTDLVRVGGQLSNRADISQIEATARVLFGNDVLIGIGSERRVGLRDSAELVETFASVGPVLRSSLDEAEVTLTNDTLQATGQVGGQVSLARLEDAARAAGLETDLQLTEPPPPSSADAGTEAGIADDDGDPIRIDPTGDDTALALSRTRIPFGAGSAILESDASAIVEDVASTLADRPDLSVILVGSASATEAPALASQRATAVRDALVAAGVAPARVQIGRSPLTGSAVTIVTIVTDPS